MRLRVYYDEGIRGEFDVNYDGFADGGTNEPVITHLDGQPTPRLIALRRILIERSPGDEIEVTYRRGEMPHVVTMKLVSEAELNPTSAPATTPASAPATQPE